MDIEVKRSECANGGKAVLQRGWTVVTCTTGECNLVSAPINFSPLIYAVACYSASAHRRPLTFPFPLCHTRQNVPTEPSVTFPCAFTNFQAQPMCKLLSPNNEQYILSGCATFAPAVASLFFFPLFFICTGILFVSFFFIFYFVYTRSFPSHISCWFLCLLIPLLVLSSAGFIFFYFFPTVSSVNVYIFTHLHMYTERYAYNL